MEYTYRFQAKFKSSFKGDPLSWIVIDAKTGKTVIENEDRKSSHRLARRLNASKTPDKLLKRIV